MARGVGITSLLSCCCCYAVGIIVSSASVATVVEAFIQPQQPHQQCRRSPSIHHPRDNDAFSTDVRFSDTAGRRRRRLAARSNRMVLAARRNKLVLDPKTGFYRPAPRVVKEKRPIGEVIGQTWDKAKELTYSTVDVVRSVPDQVGKLQKKTTGTAADDESESMIFDGYTEVQNEVVSASRIMQEYEQRRALSKQEAKTSTSLFDKFKGAVYGTMDTASQVIGDEDDASSQSRTTELSPLQRVQQLQQQESGSSSTTGTVPYNLAASSKIREALPDLESENPVRRAFAKYRIKSWERKQRQQQREAELAAVANKVKGGVYKVGDAVQWTAKRLAATPRVVADVTAKTTSFVRSVPPTIEKTTESVVAIPQKVKRTAQGVKLSVDSGIETSKKVVADVQALPEKVQKTAVETKDTIEGAVDAVNDATTRVKVVLGLEKAKPRPPKRPPPKPLSASDVGWKVAGGVVSGTAKLAWWVGKGVAAVTWNGAETAVKKSVDVYRERKGLPPIFATNGTSPAEQNAMASASSSLEQGPETTTDGGKRPTTESDLDREVADALQLAEDAIRLASEATPESNEEES